MILSFYIILNLLVVFFFFRYRKKIFYPLEIFMYWMIGTIFVQNFSAIHFMNWKTLIISAYPSLEYAHVLNRLVLLPICFVIFLQVYRVSKSKKCRFFIFLLFVGILTGLEWLSDLLGVFDHVNWKLWWSYLYWAMSLFLTILFMKYFQKKLVEGRNQQ